MAHDSLDVTPQQGLEEARLFLEQEEKFMPDGIEGIIILFLNTHERRQASNKKSFQTFINAGLNIHQVLALIEEVKIHMAECYHNAYFDKQNEELS